eukprot:14268903-Heterocapsa_arctica.AAC.1
MGFDICRCLSLVGLNIGLSSSEFVENNLQFARNSMATTRRSEIMFLDMLYPHVKTYGNYNAPVCGALVHPEPIL